MKFSVIIPTYNRADILTKCLEALEKQTLSKEEFEVIVVNDGGSDETPRILDRFKEKLNLTALTQKNSGQGNARNHGLDHAKGEIVVLLGDDIIPMPNFLSEHLKTHRKNPVLETVVLGLIDWHPNLELNDYMKWMVNGSSIFGKFGGHQFAYEKLDHGQSPDFNFFYTSNLSIKREFLGKNPFDPVFNTYGWEDIELGYRLEKEKKMKMHYNPRAIGHHWHPMDESGLQKRMEMIGRSAHIIDRKYPELKKVPRPAKKMALSLLSNPVSLTTLKTANALSGKRLQAFYYYALSKKYFLQGVKAGYNPRSEP